MLKKLIIIDAHALIHRAYHALPPLVSPEGQLVNGVYGFLLVFFKIIEELKPNYVIATFDLPGPTLRHQVFKEYKAKRVKAPENFYQQIEILKEILKVWGIKYLEKEGYEADDLIGTIVEKFKNQKDLEIIILTGDLDTLQLIKDNVKVYTFRRGLQDKIIYDLEKVKERFDLEPEQLRDYKALKGDPSDNILGVPKVGEKIAQRLIKKYQSLDGIYKAIESGEKIDVPPPVLESLKKFKDQAYFSQQLVTIIKDIDIDISLEEAIYKNPPKSLIPLFRKLGFQSFIQRIFSFNRGLIFESREKRRIEIKEVDTQDLSFLFQQIAQASKIGLKLEFEGSNYLAREIKSLKVITDQEKDMIYILKKESINDFITQLIKVISQEKKKEIILLERKIILEEFSSFTELESYCLDLDILAWLIDPERRKYHLMDLVRFFLKKNLIDENETFAEIFNLAEQIKIKAESLNLWYVYEEIERPLVKILADMEKNGVFLNRDKFQEMLKIIQKEKKELEEKIYKISGFIFNLSSPIQVQEVLFQKLKISQNGLERTKTGKISTDLESLKKIEKNHPIVPLIISWRKLEKFINSFLLPLPDFISPISLRIHPIWNQTGTVTGRLSCSSPNLQNIPYKGEMASKIRSAFEAEKDNFLISLDYSQIELRLAAHLSSDPFLLEAFSQNRDIHRMIASYLFHVKEEEVNEAMRNQAKTLNYGILYGLGDKNLANYMGVTLEEAKKFKTEFFSKFFGLKNFLEYSLEKAKELGYAETIFGRKRFLPLLGAYNQQGKEQERAAINMPIQGLAADLMKKTMIEIDKYLKENQLKDEIKLIIQIHDELIFEGKKEIINKVKDKLIEIAENIHPLNVPLKVEAKIGKNLAEI